MMRILTEIGSPLKERLCHFLIVFQKTGEQYPNIYDIPYYNTIKMYLRFLGLDPHQKYGLIIVIIMVTSMTSVLIPMFRKLFDYITKEWQQLELSQDLYILEEVTIRGSKIAKLYRNTLLICMVLFILIPLTSPMLDIVLPLNETRPRQQLVNVNYVLFDSNNHFFCVYLQLSWTAIVVSISIVTVDSLLMLIVHHNSGLFIVCG
ncbi:uncharacterized protein LOC122572230 isoform X3 [Bombus pyrosoma]|uniref:uncharacterized protein LOC122572230 isoform X3 n=1 Tax=Bombus pyrosoma TaxID=396416 RepID=UPI001CB95759|nr:uncharacterized protein LOC122572230 isoform X3 [Bombus pyrosoma]